MKKGIPDNGSLEALYYIPLGSIIPYIHETTSFSFIAYISQHVEGIQAIHRENIFILNKGWMLHPNQIRKKPLLSEVQVDPLQNSLNKSRARNIMGSSKGGLSPATLPPRIKAECGSQGG